MPAIHACTACGVCCFSSLETYVRVMGTDWTRLGDQAERFARFIGNRAYMAMEHGHCTALKIEKSLNGDPVYLCQVYEQRPQICRDLNRGSRECEGERMSKAERVKGAKVQ